MYSFYHTYAEFAIKDSGKARSVTAAARCSHRLALVRYHCMMCYSFTTMIKPMLVKKRFMLLQKTSEPFVLFAAVSKSERKSLPKIDATMFHAKSKFTLSLKA